MFTKERTLLFEENRVLSSIIIKSYGKKTLIPNYLENFKEKVLFLAINAMSIYLASFYSIFWIAFVST